MVVRLKELSEMKTKKQFHKLDNFSCEVANEDEFYESENLWLTTKQKCDVWE